MKFTLFNSIIISKLKGIEEKTAVSFWRKLYRFPTKSLREAIFRTGLKSRLLWFRLVWWQKREGNRRLKRVNVRGRNKAQNLVENVCVQLKESWSLICSVAQYHTIKMEEENDICQSCVMPWRENVRVKVKFLANLKRLLSTCTRLSYTSMQSKRNHLVLKTTLFSPTDFPFVCVFLFQVWIEPINTVSLACLTTLQNVCLCVGFKTFDVLFYKAQLDSNKRHITWHHLW